MIRIIVVITLFGAMSYAEPDVLETVAQNRAAGLTSHSVPKNWRDYEILIAVEDCRWVGRRGVLKTARRQFSALVVDCQAEQHRREASLSSLGLLADTNYLPIVHEPAELIIYSRQYRSQPMEH